MTISPVMIKVLAWLAVQTAADEQARKRLFVVILTPVLILLLLIAFIIYLLVSPLTLFMGWMFGDSEIAAIEAFQKEYGYNQNLGIFDQDYVNGSAQSYEEIGRASCRERV